MNGFPLIRPRRMRMSPLLRDMAAEAVIRREKLIQPHFVVEGSGQKQDISTMPGIQRNSIDTLLQTLESDLKLGIRNHILFGLTDDKDAVASSSHGDGAVIVRALKEAKKAFGADIMLSTDVCLCAYTDSGHCGIVSPEGEIENDSTSDILAKMAVSHARAGADMVAPSDMMDGRVLTIRKALDNEGLHHTPIMSYAVKYASAFYGPFREAADSSPEHGDRKSHQMDPRNAEEAIREAQQDVLEGADIIMVKPALSYLDIIARLRQQLTVPLAAYQVSGEYSMVHFAAQAGAADLRATALETLTSISRAGAEIILSYFTRQLFAENWMQ